MKKNKKFFKVLSVFIIGMMCFICTAAPTKTSAATSASSTRTLLYRHYNGKDHYYTTKFGVVPGYKFEQVVGYVYTAKYNSALTPVYRYYNGTDHFYTSEWGELGSGRNGYKYEGIEFYATTKPDSASHSVFPVYRYYNGTEHFYTPHWDELKNGDGKYKYERIAFYI